MTSIKIKWNSKTNCYNIHWTITYKGFKLHGNTGISTCKLDLVGKCRLLDMRYNTFKNNCRDKNFKKVKKRHFILGLYI